jgi:hypothetical protein
MAEELASRLRSDEPGGIEVTVVHRDLGRE